MTNTSKNMDVFPSGFLRLAMPKKPCFVPLPAGLQQKNICIELVIIGASILQSVTGMSSCLRFGANLNSEICDSMFQQVKSLLYSNMLHIQQHTHTQLNIPRVQCKWHCPQCPGWAPHAWGRHALARHVRARRGCARPVRAHHDWARRGWARRGWARRGWAPHKASWVGHLACKDLQCVSAFRQLDPHFSVPGTLW